MSWFNYYGLIYIVAIMVPNIVFAVKCKNGFENIYRNKLVETLEQISRFGCFIFMIINIPYTYFGFYFENALLVYLVIDSVLVAVYCLIWIICFRKNGVFRSLALSIIPSALFIFSGIMIRSMTLTACALIFAPCHILISYKNAKR